MRYTHQQHLRRQADFLEIRASGIRRECGFFYVNILNRPKREPALRRVGIIASRRIGNAVARNRAKRRLRDLFRRNQDALPASCDLVLIARPYIFRATGSELEAAFLKAMEKLSNQME